MTDVAQVDLALNDCWSVTAYGAPCARSVSPIVERLHPNDKHVHAAVEAAELFVDGARRSKLLRDSAWPALRAAGETAERGEFAASEAAPAVAAGTAYLHPLAAATQVGHILGSAAHAVRAIELARPSDARSHLSMSIGLATPEVPEVLRRYPAAPSRGGRLGEWVRELDVALR